MKNMIPKNVVRLITAMLLLKKECWSVLCLRCSKSVMITIGVADMNKELSMIDDLRFQSTPKKK
jgi:hypothetical protein